ncbi:DUF1326 domain-containing protein [Singulisphaera sp. PoT]|uniref:DUF1326 domain-containing protein n=1 Tax=Singulisphaera sp. PoT TaxID=3411797 RepID=UPI003BF47D31
MNKRLSVLCGALILAMGTFAHAGGIQGDYVEARTADVFTGPCFSNAEIFIYGKQAVMAWKVSKGDYQGVDLSGLSVAAAVQGTTTFSEDKPEAARAILIVDSRANQGQREALISLAKELGGLRLANIVDVRRAPIKLKVEAHSEGDQASHQSHGMPTSPRASFWAAGLAQIITRPLDDGDHFCGNEVVAYQPLSKGVKAVPAYTLGHQFKGEGLESTWDDPNCRSSFVGRFSL